MITGQQQNLCRNTKMVKVARKVFTNASLEECRLGEVDHYPVNKTKHIILSKYEIWGSKIQTEWRN